MTAVQLNPNSLLGGSALSALAHLSLGGGLYCWLALREPAPIVAELDLSMAPVTGRAPNVGGRRGAQRADPWSVRDAVAEAPVPAASGEVIKGVVRRDQDLTAPCEGACPDEKLVGQGASGGSGEGDGEFVPAESTARGPRWLRNFITTSDYPLVARRQGQDGRVVLSVWIARDGRVVDARLLEGSYEVLNEVALRKVKQAVFSPAYDADGRPVSCKVTLPIRFELR